MLTQSRMPPPPLPLHHRHYPTRGLVQVVIVSLVRSNHDGAIGFLNILNRVNVMLSRAKHGMYLLGNLECLRSSRKSEGLWVRPLQPT